MLTILTCVTSDHDLRLVLLAALVCALGVSVTVQLLLRARLGRGAPSLWLCLGGVTFGASVWSTHFIAMLAYQPSALMGYAPVPTALSLVLAVLVSSGGFLFGAVFQFRGASALAGGFVGLGVAAMHYVGMHALADAGLLSWEGGFVVASIAVGVAFGALGMILVRRSRAALATVALIFAICALHFTGMAALTIQPLAAAPSSTPLVSNLVIALATAAAAMLILGAALIAFVTDKRVVKQSRKRLRTLADAAIEGLIVVENGYAIDWNKSFESLSGRAPQDVAPIAIHELINEIAPGDPSHPRAMHVVTGADGVAIPVELLTSVDAQGSKILAVRDLRDKIASENRIHYLAHYDALTALPNRLALLEHLERALAREGAVGGELAVLALDLDRFKEVNDVFGHGVGDVVLMQVAATMQGALRDGEFLARIGGDEFVVVQHGTGQPDGASDICERLIAAATSRIGVDGNVIQLGVSIGVALYPRDAATGSELMANADLAMYRAKDSVTSGACFFATEMDDKVRLRRALARDLRQAIEREELELYYQAQTSITRSEVVGYEVLLRWKHPESGFIPPSHFIPIAEESGLIMPIGEWVLETACCEAARWSQPYRVAVNVSGVQFSQGDLPAVVLAALVKSGLDPKRLELEITETVLITDMDRALGILRRLKAIGVSIAMDDFGTGYSSLSTLKAFPFDKIKIDRSFIDQVETHAQARSIVRAILALGRSLDIPVLAEGVETDEHLAFLREEGCDEAQGYLLGRPGPLSSAVTDAPSEDSPLKIAAAG